MSAAKKSILNIISILDQNIRCSVCSNYINKPMKNICGHRYCYNCVYVLANPDEKAKIKLKKCPDCSSRLKLLIEDTKFWEVSKKIQILLPMLGTNYTLNKPIDKKEIFKEKPIRLKQILQKLVSDIEAADKEDFDDYDDENDFEDSKIESPKKKHPKFNNAKKKKKVLKKTVSKNSKNFASKNLDAQTKNENKQLPSNFLTKEQKVKHDISFFSASFLDTFGPQHKTSLNTKNEKNNLSQNIEKVKKLAEYGCNPLDYNFSNVNLSHLTRDKVTYSKFDKLKETFKKSTSTQTDTAEMVIEKEKVINKEQQSEDKELYFILLKIFKKLCAKHENVGSVIIEAFDLFKIKLSQKTLEIIKDNNIDKLSYLIQEPKLQASILVNKEIQTDCTSNTLKKITYSQHVATDPVSLDTNFTQTELDYFVSIGKEKKISKNFEMLQAVLSQQKSFSLTNSDASKKKLNENVQNVSLNQKSVSRLNYLLNSNETKKSDNDAEISSQNPVFISKTDEHLNQNAEDEILTQNLFSQYSMSSSSKNLDFSQILEFHNDQTTQVQTQTEVNSKYQLLPINEDKNVEVSSEVLSLENGTKATFNEIVMESDEDDDFLMRCVFECFNENDDHINDVESIELNSQSASTKFKTSKQEKKVKVRHSKVFKKPENKQFTSSKLRIRI